VNDATDPAAIAQYEHLERQGFSFRKSELTHYDELVLEGLSSEHASIATRIAARRETAEFYPKIGEVLHAISESLGNTLADHCLRLALGDDGLTQAQIAASLGVSEATVSMTVKRTRERLGKALVKCAPYCTGTNF
jgi:predicted DNA-binding protein (UPF0251 family)